MRNKIFNEIKNLKFFKNKGKIYKIVNIFVYGLRCNNI